MKELNKYQKGLLELYIENSQDHKKQLQTLKEIRKLIKDTEKMEQILMHSIEREKLEFELTRLLDKETED